MCEACNLEHFEEDVREYTKRGLVTRREFGMLAGAAALLTLPGLANALDVTESQVNVLTADGMADAILSIQRQAKHRRSCYGLPWPDASR